MTDGTIFVALASRVLYEFLFYTTLERLRYLDSTEVVGWYVPTEEESVEYSV